MKTLKSNTGREFRISSNKSKRTYTIKVNGFTYRTYPMSSEEFNSCDYNTGNDWAQFLTSSDYYKVK